MVPAVNRVLASPVGSAKSVRLCPPGRPQGPATAFFLAKAGRSLKAREASSGASWGA